MQGVSFEEYSKSYTLRRVTERAIQIISEAAKALPSNLTASYPAAPWHAIIAIGNILRHEYQYVDDRRLWEIVTTHLPPLPTVVIEMLRDLGGLEGADLPAPVLADPKIPPLTLPLPAS